jgi:hypothetical protein
MPLAAHQSVQRSTTRHKADEGGHLRCLYLSNKEQSCDAAKLGDHRSLLLLEKLPAKILWLDARHTP